ncbi:MAG: serine hydrolase [Planctomycetota bacterium]
MTAAAIRRVADKGMLNLNDRVFDVGQPGGGILSLNPFPSLGDERLADVTVLDLLRHRGGWDRSISPDYAFWDLQISDEMGLDSPPGPLNKARYLMGKPLDHAPGSQYAYSNLGFMMLGLVLEEVTGQEYLDAVHEHVFDPLGVPREEVQVGRTFAEDRGVREPFYDQPEAWSATNVYDPNGPSVRWPDGGWDQEGADAYGGLVASTKALLAFGENHVAFGNNIGRVRSGNEGPNWWSAHSGSLIGTDTLLHQRGNGLTFALLFNRRPTAGPSYVSQLDDDILQVLLDPKIVWPDALLDPADGTGDGWVTREDLLALNAALHASDSDDFLQAYPDGQYLAFDLDGDGVVSGLDIPEIRDLFFSYGTDSSGIDIVGDFDGDWELTLTDLEQLYENLGNAELAFDINGDGTVDVADVEYWVSEIFQTLVSDANLDGVSDVSDFNIWNRNRFQLADWTSGDYNFDGLVDVSDFNIWNRERFSSLGDTVAVPEPAVGLMTIFVVFALAIRLRQRDQ